MSLNVDTVVDRRRLRRKLGLWRTLAVIAAIVAIVAVIAASGRSVVGTGSAHVARVTIGGLIRSDRARLDMLDEIGKSGARAVILSIDSPGGTVVGSESLYNGIRRLAEKKPVIAVVQGMAASGAYVAALGADRIFAHRNAIVGSIGVVYQNPNVSELLKHLGVTVEDIKSSPLKLEPNPYSPSTPEGRAAMRDLVLDSYAWFKGLVRDRRRLDDAKLALATDGRVFTAAQGLPLNLVDEIGDERSARAWLAVHKAVSEDLPVRDWRGRTLGSEFRWLGVVAWLADQLGLPLLGGLMRDEALANAAAHAQLDGLLAIWQPSTVD